MLRNPKSLQSGIVIGLMIILGGQIAASHIVAVSERPLANPGFATLPNRVDQWVGSGDQALEPLVFKTLRPDDYILRDYARPGGRDSINLFAAYFKSLQQTYGPHSPRVCLPGAGWLTRSWKPVTISVAGKRGDIPVNQYFLEKNGQFLSVMYWYQNNRRVWSQEFQAKLHLLPDLIRYRRSDVSLVRIVTPVASPARFDDAWQESVAFARTLFPLLEERMAAVD
jgi:EpsI family protein